jgi:hypothetical protein
MRAIYQQLNQSLNLGLEFNGIQLFYSSRATDAVNSSMFLSLYSIEYIRELKLNQIVSYED